MIFVYRLLTSSSQQSKEMPGVSKETIVSQLFESLTDVEGFPLTIEQLNEYLSKSNFKMKKQKDPSVQRKINPYNIYLKQNKKSLEDTDAISAEYQKIKKEWEEGDKTGPYQELLDQATEQNKERGIDEKATKSAITATAKTRIELIKALQEKRKTENPEEEIIDKPIFSGKLPMSAINNFKEWLKQEQNLPVDHTFSRETISNLKIEHSFNPKMYDDSCEWFEYIKDNMDYYDGTD